jgi:hypothetical protein
MEKLLEKYIFPGIERDANGAYYYPQDAFPRAAVPICKELGDYPGLTFEVIDDYFKISGRLPTLPKYLILPHLRSDDRPGKGWDISGEIVVYEPIEWIPKATIVNSFPRSEFE